MLRNWNFSTNTKRASRMDMGLSIKHHSLASWLHTFNKLLLLLLLLSWFRMHATWWTNFNRGTLQPWLLVRCWMPTSQLKPNLLHVWTLHLVWSIAQLSRNNMIESVLHIRCFPSWLEAFTHDIWMIFLYKNHKFTCKEIPILFTILHHTMKQHKLFNCFVTALQGKGTYHCNSLIIAHRFPYI